MISSQFDLIFLCFVIMVVNLEQNENHYTCWRFIRSRIAYFTCSPEAVKNVLKIDISNNRTYDRIRKEKGSLGKIQLNLNNTTASLVWVYLAMFGGEFPRSWPAFQRVPGVQENCDQLHPELDNDLDALETTGWEPLSTQYKKKLLTLMYKVNCRITSDKITNLFSIANPHYNLRNSNHFALPRFNLDTGRNSTRYRGPIAWATTPTCLKHATTLKNFKKLLKQRRHKLFIKNISFGKEACMVSHKDQDFTYF